MYQYNYMEYLPHTICMYGGQQKEKLWMRGLSVVGGGDEYVLCCIQGWCRDGGLLHSVLLELWQPLCCHGYRCLSLSLSLLFFSFFSFSLLQSFTSPPLSSTHNTVCLPLSSSQSWPHLPSSLYHLLMVLLSLMWPTRSVSSEELSWSISEWGEGQISLSQLPISAWYQQSMFYHLPQLTTIYHYCYTRCMLYSYAITSIWKTQEFTYIWMCIRVSWSNDMYVYHAFSHIVLIAIHCATISIAIYTYIVCYQPWSFMVICL